MGHRWGGGTVAIFSFGQTDPGSGVASAVRLRARLGLPSLMSYSGSDVDASRAGLSTIAVSTIALRVRLGIAGAL